MFKIHHTSDYLFFTLYSFFTLFYSFYYFYLFSTFYYFTFSTFLYVENKKIMDRLVNSATPHVELHVLFTNLSKLYFRFRIDNPMECVFNIYVIYSS
jgi:hypothetical protein